MPKWRDECVVGGLIMKSFKEFIAEMAESEIDYLVLELTEEALLLPLLQPLTEGRWEPAGYKDFMIRVDPMRPETKEQRHVHIARQKHATTKNQQVAWNQDGSRHDKKSFNTSLGQQDAVRNIAAKVLNIRQELLETLDRGVFGGGGLLLESDAPQVTVWRLVVRS